MCTKETKTVCGKRELSLLSLHSNGFFNNKAEDELVGLLHCYFFFFHWHEGAGGVIIH